MSALGRATVAVATLLCGAASGAAEAGATSVTLPEAAMTSAGVFDSTGHLVRTLWSGRREPAGTLAIAWDGRDDDGDAVPSSARYTARVLAHDVRYVWEGVIGNTSRDATGPHVHRAFGPINDMAIDRAGNAFYVVGYNELQHAIHRFQTSDPQLQSSLAHDDYLRVFRYAATDGTLAYFANAQPAPQREAFVVALDVSDGTEHRFPSGRLVMPGQLWGNRWESVLDYEPSGTRAPTGLAVQQRGDNLFVAHASANEIRVLDKHDGRQRTAIPATAPTDLDVAPDDSLWALCQINGRGAVAHYRLQRGEWQQQLVVSHDLVQPVAIGVSPFDGTLVVADAGSEQLKAFDERGDPLWTLGSEGGYRNGRPAVSRDRFWFAAGPTYVTFAPDGSFWFGDPGNLRNLHFSAQREYDEEIMYLPASYSTSVDLGNPARVFRHFLEFEVDYAQPLRKSWTLVRNWAAGLDGRYFGDFLAGLRQVVTLGNGRTYAVVHRYDAKVDEVVELTQAGLRATGKRLDTGQRLYADGSLRSHVLRPGTLQVYSRKLTGFDANANPQWAEATLLASASRLKSSDPYYHDVPSVSVVNDARYPQTDGGVIVSFNPGKSQGFHLGGLQPGREGWLWRASPSGSWDLDRDGEVVSRDGRYELGRGVHYPGNIVSTAGHHIVYGYHGEAWNGGQANQWVHFLDNGLFVGQFGRPVYPAANRGAARPERAGNAFASQLVSVGGQLYLWHNDESVHGGIHRWRIDGANRMRILEASIEP